MTPRPYTLVAELTHRCPLSCAYCSNPVDLVSGRDELTTAEWIDVLQQAAALGVVQVHFTGGEPLARRDLTDLIRHARRLDLYTNLITSGVPLDEARFEELVAAGIDHVQLSVQSLQPANAIAISGVDELQRKKELAIWVKRGSLPLTINVVLHRLNIDETSDLIEFAALLGADRLELANTQFHGWARANLCALIPTEEQLARAAAIARDAQKRFRATMEIVFVRPVLHRNRPSACMDGWARRFIVVAPDGTTLPCHAAKELRGFEWHHARDHSLASSWGSAAFERFRGDSWMREPCRSCSERVRDFGGCRCQAFALTGDASATDPACDLSPHHSTVTALRARQSEPPVLQMRRTKR